MTDEAESPEAPEPAPPPRQAAVGGRHISALDAALRVASWITPADAPVVEYARALAAQLDSKEAAAADLGGGLVSESPQYLLALKALRLDPASRAKEADRPVAPPMFDAAGY